MGTQPFTATISGNPNVTTIKEANVRAAPGTGTDAAVLFKSPVGTANLPVLEVKADPQGTNLNNKIYQWFRLQFPNGQAGWVRDDLLSVVGDGRQFGYSVLAAATYAFNLTRSAATAPSAAPAAGAAAGAAAGMTASAPPKAAASGMTPSAPVKAAAPATGDATPAPAPVAAPAAPAYSGPPKAKVIAKTGANLRAAPVSGNIISKIEFGTEVNVIGGAAQGNSTNYVWAKVSTPKGEGFIRNTFLSIKGDASTWGLSAGDEYPAPMANYWWVRGYGIGFANNDPVEVEHLGWDFGANEGETMLAGPYGGTVTQVMQCTKCTPAAPSTLMQGLSLGDTSVFSDAGWGFGYGNFVVVRYDSSILPASTKKRLEAAGFGGAHLFALYGHLQKFSVQPGYTLKPNEAFGACGNTGNSEASHLHLELRAGKDPAAQWASLRKGLMDPGVLFSH